MTIQGGATPEPRRNSPSADDIKLIAFDLDGTLFNRDVEVSSRTASTLARVAERGVHLVVATGRGHRSVVPRVSRLRFMRWAVCSNGAYLHDLLAHRPVRSETIPGHQVTDLRLAVEQTLPDTVWAWQTPLGHFWTESFLASDIHQVSARNVIADQSPPPPLSLKIFVGHPEVSTYELLDLIRPAIPHDLGVSTSGAAFVEVTAPGVNKAKALADLCIDLGVAQEQTLAFGDNVNDIEMLQWAGWGYAMANAHTRLLDVASFRTERTHEDDGVARTLERIFDLDQP